MTLFNPYLAHVLAFKIKKKKIYPILLGFFEPIKNLCCQKIIGFLSLLDPICMKFIGRMGQILPKLTTKNFFRIFGVKGGVKIRHCALTRTLLQMDLRYSLRRTKQFLTHFLEVCKRVSKYAVTSNTY